MDIRVQMPSASHFWLAVLLFVFLLQNFALLCRGWKLAGKHRRLMMGVGLSGLSAFGVFLLIEAFFVFAYDQTDDFGITKSHVRWVMRHVELNRLGFRDHDHPLVKSPEDTTYRIAVLGDFWSRRGKSK